jgi:hypothetical protein
MARPDQWETTLVSEVQVGALLPVPSRDVGLLFRPA